MKRTKEIVAPAITKRQKMVLESRERTKSLRQTVTTEYDEIIYPTNLDKYIGGIRFKYTKWYAKLSYEKGAESFKFDTEEEAHNFVIESNKKSGAEIRNIIYLYDGKYYCDTNRDDKMIIISKESIPLVNKHLIGANSVTSIKGKQIPFNQILCNRGDGEKIVYLNGDTSDHRVENVRSMTMSEHIKLREAGVTQKRSRAKMSAEKKVEINAKLKKVVMAHAIVTGKKERTPENLAIADDLTEYEERYERDVDLWEVITTESEVIWPTNFKKYNGNVRKQPHGRWQAKSQYGPLYRCETAMFDTEDEAKEYIMNKSREEGTVKNVIYKFGDEYYCALTNNQLMLFSFESMDLVQEHVLYAHYEPQSRCYYVRTKINGKTLSFHPLLCTPNPGETIDHISTISLDNRLENLRSVPLSIQNLNKKYNESETGIRGVRQTKKDGAIIGYTAYWATPDGPLTKYFSAKKYGKEKALEMAVALRNEKEESIDSYKKALGK